MLSVNQKLRLYFLEFFFSERDKTCGRFTDFFKSMILISTITLFFKTRDVNEYNFFLHVFVGYFIFFFISNNIASGIATTNRHIENYKSLGRSYNDYFCQKLFNNSFSFIISMAVLNFIMMYYKIWNYKFFFLILFYSAFIIFFNFYVLKFFYFFNIIFNKFKTLVDMIVRLSFFASPIMWIQNYENFNLYSKYNPFTNIIDLIRKPIVLDNFASFNVLYCLIIFSILFFFVKFTEKYQLRTLKRIYI